MVLEASISVTLAGREAFAALRKEWTELWRSMDYSTPFSSWEWADCWLQTIGSDAPLLIAIARRDGRTVGILPLARLGSSRMRTFTLLGFEQVFPDHLGVIAAGEAGEAVVAPLLRAALGAAGRISRVDLPMVAEGSETDQWCARSGLPGLCRSASIAPYIRIQGSYEEFLEGLSGNERYKIRNRTRKLLGMTGVRFGAVSPGDLPGALRRLRELHALRAAAKGIRSSFDLDEVQDFHTRLIRSLPSDSLTFRGLWSEDEIFALFYGFNLDKRMFYFQLGFDPAWGNLSPGIVLLSEVIREAHETGCLEFNFLQGDEPFKRTWTRQRRTLNNWTFYNPGPAGFARKQMDSGLAGIKAMAKKLLPQASSST